MVQIGKIVEFDQAKSFTHIKPLGYGGTGDTHLFKDEITDMYFAIKKYAPKDDNFLYEHYQRFVDEIKILFNISHPNIVRVYNYYLYPEHKSGYLQMEYIDGTIISNFKPHPFGKDWATIFNETILAFEYLESKGILHRDLRPANIMIDKNEQVKIIDFGFGKKLTSEDTEGKSVFLNWPVTQLPNEINQDGTYNHQTEIYFVGNLFSRILKGKIDSFKFKHIIDKMCKLSTEERYKSFQEISFDISQGVISEIQFTEVEKGIYQDFADTLTEQIKHYKNNFEPIYDVNIVLSKLETLIRNSSLETYIQDNGALIGCFINQNYIYFTQIDIEVPTVMEFYQFMQSLAPYKQKIVLDNIYMRLSTIPIIFDFEDLPF